MSEERPTGRQKRQSPPERGRGVWGKLFGLPGATAVLLMTNCLTIARQGVEHWWASIVSNGELQCIWVASERPPGISIRAKAENGKGVEFDLDTKVSVAAGRYAITVMQFDRQLPVTVLSSTGKEISYAEVARFRTELLRIKAAPTDPVFSGVYDQVADGLGRPKSPSRHLPRVFQGFHENGTLLWFYDTNTFLVLRAGDGTCTEVQGPPYPRDPCLYEQDCIDARTHPPKGMHAEIGGGYGLWNNTLRKDLGWMTGYCIYWDGVVREDFERGFLIGPLRAAPFGETSVGIGVFSDRDPRHWREPTLFGVKPPECHAAN
jgi:hypothetical protein